MKQAYIFILSFLFLQFPSVKAQVIINELMPRNISYLINEDFNFEGWVELYNSGTQSADISNYYFSDDSNNLLKWRIKTDRLLDPEQFVVIYFDELDRENHASFKLQPEGGSLFLSDRNKNLVSEIRYPISSRNISYGRKTDGGANVSLGYFLNATPGKSNNGAVTATGRADAPVFSLPAGFYSSDQQVTIQTPTAGARIYYTTDGSEPVIDDAFLYTAPVSITRNTPLRAIAVVNGALPSELATASYFINSGSNALPVVSLVTDSVMFFSDETGMLVAGKNGSEVPYYCSGPDLKANYWNDWDRPCNFEFFDANGRQQLNQEVKVGNFGNCSRTKFVKSIKINTTKAHGGEKGSRLNYAIFKEKPNLQWKSVVLRNSGNDFGHSFLRDAFMQQIVAEKMDVDYQAYQPSVVFVNGKYYGMLNIRERTNKDFIYSNYGLDEGEFDLVEYAEGDGSSDEYWQLVEFSRKGDMNAPDAYEYIDSQIDINEFLSYFIAQIYYANTDWPGGNIKAWKRKENGKWRWILYDTDFGFSLYRTEYATNTITQAAQHPFFAGFLKNDKIRERFITKFLIHLQTTFDENRVINLLNEMASHIEPDALVYDAYLREKKKIETSSWEGDLEAMRVFAQQRPDNIYKHLATYFKLGAADSFHIHSNIENVTYLMNDEKADISDFKGIYYKGLDFRAAPVIPDGFRFKHWEILKPNNWVNFDDTWKYYDQGEITSTQWKESGFDDAGWSSGQAPLGYGMSNFVKTTVKYGSVSSRNITTYFRKEINVNESSQAGKLYFTLQVNDGAVVYLNGSEIYRTNLPESEEILYATAAVKNLGSSYAESTFEIAPDLLVEGKNVLAVEVHQVSKTNGTLGFALSLAEENTKTLRFTDTNQVYKETFTGGDYKAVFEPDPGWQESLLPQLYLNEICVTNSQYVDEFFEKDDWIELYNDGNVPVNIGGMYISNSRKDLKKYRIPDDNPLETTVPAKSYAVLWADSQPQQGTLHLGFSLSATDTETVSLSQEIDGELHVIDAVGYKSHVKGETFARFSVALTEDWMLTSRPTFAAPNVYAVPTIHPSTDITSVFSDGEHIARIYPNPVSETLWFSQAKEQPVILTIMNLTGVHLFEREVSNGDGINVSFLPSGLYFAVIHSSAGKQVVKFIKR
ncbi:MAG: CotH kinase family protein [Prevotellaceae bacterium]|jgi:hypothetical protein|nr:CotH kinase family protein [Prevotellaceae bacterium]